MSNLCLHCPQCSYDLTTSAHTLPCICPECGLTISSRHQQLAASPPRWLLIACGLSAAAAVVAFAVAISQPVDAFGLPDGDLSSGIWVLAALAVFNAIWFFAGASLWIRCGRLPMLRTTRRAAIWSAILVPLLIAARCAGIP